MTYGWWQDEDALDAGTPLQNVYMILLTSEVHTVVFSPDPLIYLEHQGDWVLDVDLIQKYLDKKSDTQICISNTLKEYIQKYKHGISTYF